MSRYARRPPPSCSVFLGLAVCLVGIACSSLQNIEGASQSGGADAAGNAGAGSTAGGSASDTNASANPNTPSSSGNGTIGVRPVSSPTGFFTQGSDGYTVAMCLADLQKVMAHAGDSSAMSSAQQQETAEAIVDVAARYFSELPSKSVAHIIMGDIRQESDFQYNNVSGERDGSGQALGLLQVSPYGNSLELKLFQAHASVTSLPDYNTKTPINAASLEPNDLFDPWLNIHVATWIQSNLARSGSADPTDWGKKQGPRQPTYLTALGSWVAGPAADDSSGYGNSGDDISAPYFKAILQQVSYIEGMTLTNAFLSNLVMKTTPVDFH